MAQCEDYPCCGHGPAPLGDGGGCPNQDGSFNCVSCRKKMPKNARSSICDSCLRRHSELEEAGIYPEDQEGY